MEEAIYNYVPIIGIPFFGDQFINVAIMVSRSFGLSLDLQLLNKNDLKKAILEVIQNPR